MRLLDFNQKCGHFLSGHLHQSWHSRLGCGSKQVTAATAYEAMKSLTFNLYIYKLLNIKKRFCSKGELGSGQTGVTAGAHRGRQV